MKELIRTFFICAVCIAGYYVFLPTSFLQGFFLGSIIAWGTSYLLDLFEKEKK